MAQLFNSRSPVLVKKGNTYGTSSAPTSVNAIISYGLEITSTQEEVERERDDLNPGRISAPEYYDRGWTFSFQTRINGSGTAGTASGLSLLYRACGFSETIVPASPGPGSVTYALLDMQAAHEWCDLLAVQGITKYEAVGCRGTFSMMLEAGQFARHEWEMQGLFTEPSQTSIPGQPFTFTNQGQGKIVDPTNTPTFTLGGTAMCLQSLNLAIGNTITGSAKAGCTPKREITSREITCELVMEAKAYGDFNQWAKHITRAEDALVLVHGTTAGSITEINIPRFAYGTPTRTDNNGIEYTTVPIHVLHTAGQTNDLTIIER